MTQSMTVRIAILFLLLGTTMAWSQRTRHRPTAEESKISPRFSSHHGLDDVPYPKDDHEESYVDSEEQKSHNEQEEAVGKEDSDDSVKNDEYLEHSEKAGDKSFEAGGSSFDKHLKDHKADNKEVENVKQHDVGEKFGGEATKEHKLGKHKEKSKGHKLHGFKNVYHKEEYGDHKTFHDEFLDTDHQHNYDDHHEHQEVQGGKFSKGFKLEGKNKKYDKGDEKHEWGKEEFDGQHEGKHEKGKQSSKHRHGSKKHQGQYDAHLQKNKNSVRKLKKGVPPPPPPPPYIPHGGHHGPHQAQIEPIVPHYNPHHDPMHVQSHLYKPHVPFEGEIEKPIINNGDHGSHIHGSYDEGSHHGHGGHGHNHDDGDDDHFSSDHDSSDDDLSSEYQERRARKHHKHRLAMKDDSEEKSDEKFEPTARNEPKVHKNEPTGVSTFQPILHKNEPIVGKIEPVAHKQSVSPNYGLHQYRQPVFQDSSTFKPSEPVKQEKYSYPLSERNQRIRYGYQPRNHDNTHHQNHRNHQHQHHQNHRNPQPHNLHHSHHHHHHQEPRPFPRFQGFSRHQQQPRVFPDRGAHHKHHHHHHFRHAPATSGYQQPQTQQSKPEIHVPKVVEHVVSLKPMRSEDQPSRFSQRL